MASDLIRINNDYELPSGILFSKDDVYWGTWKYSNIVIYQTKYNPSGESPLCVVVRKDGVRIIPKEYCEHIGRYDLDKECIEFFTK